MFGIILIHLEKPNARISSEAGHDPEKNLLEKRGTKSDQIIFLKSRKY